MRLNPSLPAAGRAVTLDGSRSTVVGTGTVAAYRWQLVDGGGIVPSLPSTTAASMSVTPFAAGNFKVKLTVTDTLGREDSTTMALNVGQAAPVEVPPTPPAPASSGAQTGLKSP